MNDKKTPQELRQQLIACIMNEIVPNLKYKFNGHQFPIYFAKLDADVIKNMVTMMDCETERFGNARNRWLNEFLRSDEKELINKMNNVFWWPAVDGVWPLQCFEVKSDQKHVNNIWLLARTGPDEWVGLTSKRCYLNE